MDTPHIVYKHGDSIRVYSPSLVLTMKDGKYSANLMFLDGEAWEVIYIVYDGTYYFSRGRYDEKLGRTVGDGKVTQTDGGGCIPYPVDPADMAILYNEDLSEYVADAMTSTPRAMMCVDGTRCIIGPDFYASDNREIDIISCPIQLQAMYLGFETFDDAFARLGMQSGMMMSRREIHQ
jgi:hypothetical protein